MEAPMKQRLVGAAVLVALAVIFLPMLVKGPAPDSGVSDVPLSVPAAPASGMVSRDLPLVVPDAAPDGGAVGMPAQPDAADADAATQAGGFDLGAQPVDPSAAVESTPLPPEPTASAPAGNAADAAVGKPAANPDAAELAAAPAPEASAPEAATRLPATVAGGDYAVSFGSFTTPGAAAQVIDSLRAASLPGFRETATVDGQTVQRVRIGPYATRADAEIARQRALRVRDGVAAQVVVLDAAPAQTQAATATPAQPASSTSTSTASAPAAAQTGFAVQVGAFSKLADATALRDRLRTLGFSTFTEAVNTDQGMLTRVRVGPVVTRNEAEQLQAQLKARAGIDGIVRAHP